MAGRLVQAEAGPALVRFCSRRISRRSPLCGGAAGPGLVLVRLAHARPAGVQFCGRTAGPGRGRAGTSQVCSHRISRRSPLCGGRAGPDRGRAVASQVCSRTISRRFPLCGGTAGPGLVLVRLAHARPAGGPILWQDGWSRPGQGRH